MRVRRTAYRCPWQNAVVERFNRTLQEELLSAIVVLNLRQLNRLLSEYRTYYNTARPHMANDGEPPTPIHPVAANDSDIGHNPSRCRLEAIPWLGGLHHSYRLSAWPRKTGTLNRYVSCTLLAKAKASPYPQF